MHFENQAGTAGIYYTGGMPVVIGFIALLIPYYSNHLEVEVIGAAGV